MSETTDSLYVSFDSDTVSTGTTVTAGNTFSAESHCHHCGDEIGWHSFWSEGHVYCSYDCFVSGTGKNSPESLLYSVPPTTTGWVCPVCGRGNAPRLTTCPCRGPLPAYSIGTGGYD